LKTYAKAEDIPDEQLPKEFTFQDIDGFDFTSVVRDQEQCGSCFTTSFV